MYVCFFEPLKIIGKPIDPDKKSYINAIYTLERHM